MQPEPIYTIGHSNQSLEAFLALLDQHAIAVVVDVRSRPYARWATHFDRPPLKAAIEAAGRRYLFLGRELGGRPDGSEFYDAEGHVRYDRVAEAPWFRAGLDRLERGRRHYRIALLCSEEDPAVCHRHLLIARVLDSHDVPVNHIRGDGRVVPEAELAADQRNPARGSGQMSLFDPREVTAWRSIRSVLPRSRPPTSSEH